MNQGTKRKVDAGATDTSSRTDEDQDERGLTDKEKRRVRAVRAWDKLKEIAIKDLELPSDLNGRVSFTVKNPAGVGSSVGVLLVSDAFYISKAVHYEQWPTDCTHLKALWLFVAFKSMIHL